MVKYDSLIYGNGLTISSINDLYEKSDYQFKNYFYLNNFIKEFAFSEKHNFIYRKFISLFQNATFAEEWHQESKQILSDNIDEICTIGFERWVSKYMFLKPKMIKKAQTYIYLLYNYWYSSIEPEILKNKNKKIIEDGTAFLTNKLTTDFKAYTLNFDSIHDHVFNPGHLHGRFNTSIKEMGELILYTLPDDLFEYYYLFGTNGVEKMYRLDKIKKENQRIYNLELFFDPKLSFQNMLVYGVGFGKAEVLSEEFLEKYPKYKGNNIVGSVDGHLVLTLCRLYDQKKLNNLTIAYYSEEDRTNLESTFNGLTVSKIISLISCEELHR